MAKQDNSERAAQRLVEARALLAEQKNEALLAFFDKHLKPAR